MLDNFLEGLNHKTYQEISHYPQAPSKHRARLPQSCYRLPMAPPPRWLATRFLCPNLSTANRADQTAPVCASGSAGAIKLFPVLFIAPFPPFLFSLHPFAPSPLHLFTSFPFLPPPFHPFPHSPIPPIPPSPIPPSLHPSIPSNPQSFLIS